MPHWLIKHGASLVATPWRNGLGTTRDVVTVLGEDGTLRWQVSIADLVQDAPFSHYPHGDRVFTPIAGDPPPELAFAGGSFAPCPLLVPKRFPGDVPTLSRIPAPGRAFNAIVDRRHHKVDVRVVALAAAEAVPVEDSTTVVYCHTGALTLDEVPVGAGDALLRDPRGQAGALRARLPSQVILVALQQA